jgi:hypothetical protein
MPSPEHEKVREDWAVSPKEKNHKIDTSLADLMKQHANPIKNKE